MKLIVFGATGKTGIEIVKQGLADQHQVTAFVRTPSKVSFEHDSLRLVEGDVLDLTAVKHAIQGHEVVICSLGTSDLGKTMVRSAGTANIIKALQEAQIKRLIVISAMGVGKVGRRFPLSTNSSLPRCCAIPAWITRSRKNG